MKNSAKRINISRALFFILCTLALACGDDKNDDSDGGTDIAGGRGGNGTGSNAAKNNKCAGSTVVTSRATSSVFFVIDRSSTMSYTYDSSSRWDAVYQTLMAPGDGVISKLQSKVAFGIMLYDGQGTCPRLETVAPAMNNYDKINALYGAAKPGKYTPTALALAAAYKLVNEYQQQLDVPGLGTPTVILCTDGEPNGCPASGISSEGALTTDFEGPKKEVTTATAAGIKTYVVSVASGGAEYQAFLEEVAQIGNTGFKAFSPATKGDLVAQLSTIMGAAIGCKIELDGKVVEGKGCTGTVLLNSKTLECNSTNGWVLIDESHIELQGKACTNFKSDPTAILSVSFPCESVLLL
jgi:hypothetical protein